MSQRHQQNLSVDLDRHKSVAFQARLSGFDAPPPLWRTALDLNRAEVAHAWAEGAHWGASLFCLAAHYAENPHALARRQPISLLELARQALEGRAVRRPRLAIDHPLGGVAHLVR